MKVSLGNKVIVEVYKKEALKTQEKHGFAFIEQKLKLKGLKVLADAHLSINGVEFRIYKGSIAYIKEELLHTQAWAAKPLESDAIEVPFLVVDVNHIEFVDWLEAI